MKMMSKNDAKILAQVFVWAFNNDIEIRMRREKAYETYEYIELTFMKNNKYFAQKLDRLTPLKEAIEYSWKEIALQLCVEPMNLSEIEEA